MLCDLDHFKQINDGWGHAMGDQVLVAVANALRASTRDADTVARWGGEEFLIVLPVTRDLRRHRARGTPARCAWRRCRWPTATSARCR